VLHGWKWLVEEGRYETKWERAGGIDASNEYKALHGWRLPVETKYGRALARQLARGGRTSGSRRWS
jgi:hypothetical protein